MLNEPINITLRVAQALESLGVPYMIGGSIASAVHGVMRATMDADLIADLHPHHAKLLVEALGDEFFADAPYILEAIEKRSSFNLIHLESMFKVDVFVLKNRPFSQEEFRRRVAQTVLVDPVRTAYTATAEDTILAKLEWYQKGGGLSDRQWLDLLGVLKIQGRSLDRSYLNHWAEQLGLSEHLQRAWDEAGNIE